ncbi:adenosine kinase [Desulfoluna spongiiphila]|uniref:adenosine kinase n=1 Tax=Desulfoluna spongiiphila TaxID=419481 RepID=UPI00125BCF41|nr:adenosine kinase [Desulfoluna spongiiphila]VVS92693.1 carbohydrate kinase pfkb [Desulfoluna spongiiphila]
MYDKLNGEKRGIVGVGSALMDLLVFEDDAFLKGISEIKGGMTLVDGAFADGVLEKVTSEVTVVPGGAACNTIIGVGRLSGTATFVGKRGRDSYGDIFEKDLKQNGVTPNLVTSDTPTGRVLSIITPDAQRSMFTYLGAASELAPAEISPEKFKDAAIVLIEGYLVFNQDLMTRTLEAAKETGALVAMDLASFTVVEEALTFIKETVIPSVDILIANEDEARAFTGLSDEAEALAEMSRCADVAVLKLGARGSRIAVGGTVTEVAPVAGGDIVDTTGAGDLWAAGFLYGMVMGYPAETCGDIASACGYEVCRVTGADIPAAGWDRIKNTLPAS